MICNLFVSTMLLLTVRFNTVVRIYQCYVTAYTLSAGGWPMIPWPTCTPLVQLNSLFLGASVLIWLYLNSAEKYDTNDTKLDQLVFLGMKRRVYCYNSI